jgi:hypothetical protein
LLRPSMTQLLVQNREGSVHSRQFSVLNRVSIVVICKRVSW